MPFQLIRIWRIALGIILMAGWLVPAGTAAQTAGTSYVSPTYGYSVSWESPWFFVDQMTEGDFDYLFLSDGPSQVRIAFGAFNGLTPDDVLDALLPDEVTGEFTDVVPLRDEFGVPVGGSDENRAFTAVTGIATYADGAPLEIVEYVDVRRFAEDHAIALSAYVEVANSEGYPGHWDELFARISAAPAATDSIFADLDQVRFVFDPGVEEQDQVAIVEGIVLAEDFLAERLGAESDERLSVTALPIAAPGGIDLIAATLGSSIVVYTGSDGWLASPPDERVRTLLHEYVHYYQYTMVPDNPDEPAAWFEEGVAEYLSLLAVAEMGLMDPAVMEDFFASSLQFGFGLPPLADLESNQALQQADALVYPLSYFAVAYLLEGLPLESIGTYYRELQNGADFANAFERAFGVSPEIFYQEFEIWRQGISGSGLFPDAMAITEGTHQASSLTLVEVPSSLSSGEQAIVRGETEPGAVCRLRIQLVDAATQLEHRETFADGDGEVFWLVTFPEETPAGTATLNANCGDRNVLAVVPVTGGAQQ